MKKYANDIIGFTVFCIAALAVYGWVCHVDFASRWVHNGITMKLWTAGGLMLASLNCVLKSIQKRNGDRPDAVAGIGWTAAVWLCVLQVGILGAALLYFLTDKVNVWRRYNWDFGQTILDGLTPSLMTVLMLLTYGFAAIYKKFYAGWLLVIVGVSVMIGWLLGVPTMYFRMEYRAITAVAFNTGFCLALLGVSLLNRRKGCGTYRKGISRV